MSLNEQIEIYRTLVISKWVLGENTYEDMSDGPGGA
jgi:hypothetical protein